MTITFKCEDGGIPECCFVEIQVRHRKDRGVKVVSCSCGKTWELGETKEYTCLVKPLNPPKFPEEVFQRLHSMEQDIKTFTSSVSTELDNMGNEVESLKGDYNALDGTVNGLQGDVSKVSDSLDDLISQVDELSPSDDRPELCPYADIHEPGEKCHAPPSTYEGRDTCIMSDRGYAEGCRLTGPDITKPAQIAVPQVCRVVEDDGKGGGVAEVVGGSPLALDEHTIRAEQRAIRAEELLESTKGQLERLRTKSEKLERQIDAFYRDLLPEMEQRHWEDKKGTWTLIKVRKWADERFERGAYAKPKTIWIYQYLRADREKNIRVDREKIDVGPFATQKECQDVLDKHFEMEALCWGGPIEKPADYKLYKGKDGE